LCCGVTVAAGRHQEKWQAERNRKRFKMIPRLCFTS
jgi:hypothetical protein